MAQSRGGVEFPSVALGPMEATPRITPERAAELIEALSCVKALKDNPPPAVIVAIWSGALVKYVVNDCEVEDTLLNIAEARREGDDSVEEA